MKPNNNLTVALYERLSHDDEQQGESFSISNQKLLLETYAREHGMNNYKHFFDDGISGTRFDRPGFMAMMNGIKDGEIGREAEIQHRRLIFISALLVVICHHKKNPIQRSRQDLQRNLQRGKNGKTSATNVI